MPREKLLDEHETAEALDVDVRTLRRLIEHGLFPDALYPTPGKKRWLERDVDAYLHLRGRLGAASLRKKRKNLPGHSQDSTGSPPGQEQDK